MIARIRYAARGGQARVRGRNSPSQHQFFICRFLENAPDGIRECSILRLDFRLAALGARFVLERELRVFPIAHGDEDAVPALCAMRAEPIAQFETFAREFFAHYLAKKIVQLRARAFDLERDESCGYRLSVRAEERGRFGLGAVRKSRSGERDKPVVVPDDAVLQLIGVERDAETDTLHRDAERDERLGIEKGEGEARQFVAEIGADELRGVLGF